MGEVHTRYGWIKIIEVFPEAVHTLACIIPKS